MQGPDAGASLAGGVAVAGMGSPHEHTQLQAHQQALAREPPRMLPDASVLAEMPLDMMLQQLQV